MQFFFLWVTVGRWYKPSLLSKFLFAKRKSETERECEGFEPCELFVSGLFSRFAQKAKNQKS